MKKFPIVLLLLFSRPVYANGPYFVFEAGLSKLKTVDTTYVDTQLAGAQAQGFSTGPSQINSDGGSGKLFAGYQFNKYLAIEGGYVSLGESNTQGTGAKPGPSGANSTSVDNFTARQTFN